MFGFKKKEETIYTMPAKKFDRQVKEGKLGLDDVMKRTAFEFIHNTRGVLVLEKLSKEIGYDYYEKMYSNAVEYIQDVVNGSQDKLTLSLAYDALQKKQKDIAEKKDSNTLYYIMGCINTYANFEVWKKSIGADVNFRDIIRYTDEEVKKNAIERIYKAYSNPDEEVISRINKESVEDCIERTLRIARAMDEGRLPETCFNENGFLTREDGSEWEIDYIAQYKDFPPELVEAFFEVVDEKTGKRK